MKKILILKGQSQYSVLRNWTDSLIIGFEKKGIEVLVLDLKYSDSYILNYYLNLEFDAILGFNGYMIEDEGFKKVNKKPYIFILIDHPIDHINRINNLQDKDILTVVDRNDMRIIEKICETPKNMYLLPHAAQEISNKTSNKEIDVLFAGTYSNPEEHIRKWDKYPEFKKIFEEVANKCISNTNVYYIDEVELTLKNRGIEVDFKEQNHFLILTRDIGRYIYSLRRVNVLKEIVESGINISIFGENWEGTVFRNYKNVSINKSVKYWELQSVMRNSKVVLNIAGIANDGTHERIFAAMAAETVLVTNDTPFLKKLFKENQELIFYSFNDIQLLPNKIKTLLENTDEMFRISSNAKSAIIEKHTWEERAKEIVEIHSVQVMNT